MNRTFVLIDGDDEYECESLEEINDLIADISDNSDETVTLTLHLKCTPVARTRGYKIERNRNDRQT